MAKNLSIFSFARFFNKVKEDESLKKFKGYSNTSWDSSLNEGDCYCLHHRTYGDGETKYLVWLNQKEKTLNFLFGSEASYDNGYQFSEKLKRPQLSFDFPLEWSPNTASQVLKPYSKLCQMLFMFYKKNEDDLYYDSTTFMERTLELGRVETTEEDVMNALAEPLTNNISANVISRSEMLQIMTLGQFYSENKHSIRSYQLREPVQEMILVRHNILTSDNVSDVSNLYEFATQLRDAIILVGRDELERTTQQFAVDKLPYLNDLIDEIRQHQIRLMSSQVVELPDISEEMLEQIDDNESSLVILVHAGESRSRDIEY